MLYENIGRNIRSCRLMRRMTQSCLAEQVGISLSFLGHIERGSRKLSVDTLFHIAEVLDVPVDELMGRINEQNKIHACAREILRQALNMAKDEL